MFNLVKSYLKNWFLYPIMKLYTKKIINDPVYGLVNIPDGLVYNVLNHSFFQRLRRIAQLGLTNYVYPGANHTRFNHAIGAMHLGMLTIDTFIGKQYEIEKYEAQSLLCALLLHDIGHGPFSHLLEDVLMPVHHENKTIAIANLLNQEMNGELDTTLLILKKRHPRAFLNQLVAGQLDLDRMDYLVRDSYFTGVAEGKIGYDRIIKMMTLYDDRLAVEEKGIYSIEKFLNARRLMYWQVYLHKTNLAVEQMLIRCIKRAKELAHEGRVFNINPDLQYFLKYESTELNSDNLLKFLNLDDYDIWWALKQFTKDEDLTLNYLSNSIINRNIFKIELSKTPVDLDHKASIIRKVSNYFNISLEAASSITLTGSESNKLYNDVQDEIMIQMKNGEIKTLSDVSDYPIASQIITKYFICYPKQI